MQESSSRWVGIGLASQFRKLSSHPVVIQRTELAVWRGENGRLHVWQDRCPHRGMRFSFGFVRGNQLTCLYHGYEFDESTQCTKIPALPDVAPPNTICAESYPVEVRAGIVITNLVAADQGLPVIDGSDWVPIRSIFVHLSREKVINDDLISEVLDGRIERIDNDMFLVEILGGGQLIVAAQSVTPTKTALHVSFQDQAGYDAAQLVELSRRLVRLRSRLELLD